MVLRKNENEFFSIFEYDENCIVVMKFQNFRLINIFFKYTHPGDDVNNKFNVTEEEELEMKDMIFKLCGKILAWILIANY